MILRRLFLGRAPGIAQSFTLDQLSEQINVIVGPNGSGKTSICRALAATLWPSRDSPARLEIETIWDEDGITLRAECKGPRVSWDKDGVSVESPSLPDRHLATCYRLGVRDLMQEHSATDKEIARRIRIQMAGGYDVQGVINEGFAAKTRPGANERRAITEAKAEVGKVQSKFSALAADEDRLVGLENQRRRAKKAARELKLLDGAIELAKLRKNREDLDEDLASYPSNLDAFTGDEIGYFDQQERDLADCYSAIKALETEVAGANTKIELARLNTQRPTSANLKSWTGRLSDLRDQERDLRSACETEGQAKATLAAAELALGGESAAGALPDLSTDAIDQVAAFVKRCDELNGKEAALKGQLDLLDSAEVPESRDTLIRGASALRDWLSAPQTARSKLPVWLLYGFAVISALGVLLAYFLGPIWIGLAGLGGGALLFTYLSSIIKQEAGAELRLLARQFNECGLEMPDSWSREDVSRCLADLDQRIAKANSAEDRAAQLAMVQSQLEQFRREETEHETVRAELQSRVGVEVTSDLSLAQLMYRYRSLYDASASLAEASALVDNLISRCSGTRKKACDYLAPYDYETKNDAIGLEADFLNLKDRLADYDAATALRVSATRRLEEEKARKIAIESRTDEYFQARGIEKGERESLSKMVGQLPAYENIEQEREQNIRRILVLEHGLAERPDLLNTTRDIAEQLSDEAKLLADEHESISSDIGGIQSRVKEAQSGDALENALADLNETQSSLLSLCEQVQMQTAGRFLLKLVEAEHERSSRPPVLELAAKYFRAFTHNAYELLLPDAEEPEFRALDTSAARSLALSELSDGTRIQLLLAVRIAFAVHAERGSKVPLLFDEALSTADPERFRAVAESLLLLARDGRQIFYMTANPSDAAAWGVVYGDSSEAALHVIDLGKERSGQAAITDADLLRVPTAPEVPSPENMTDEQYGVALEVPSVDADKPIESLHLFYLLRGDLSSLYTLIRETRITTVGQWKSLSASGRAERFVPRELRQRLDALCECTREVFNRRAIGRGKLVDAEVLANSREVSGTFLPRLTELAAELDGDAEAFLAVLEDRSESRVKGFRASALIGLRAYLEDNGYVDSRPAPSSADIRLHVVAQAHSLIDSGVLTREDCGQFVDQLLAAIEIRNHGAPG